MIDPRWRLVQTVVPFLVLGTLIAFTIGVEWDRPAELLVDLGLCASAAVWILVFRVVLMRWTEARPAAVAVFLVVMIALNLALVLRDGWFGFLTIATFSFSYALAEWPWQLLPVGATATSPAFCVDDSLPSFWFANKLSSLDGGYVAIVIYRDAAGKITNSQFTSSSDGTYWNGAGAWNPSAISPLASKIPLSAGGTASVQLMFVGTMKAYGIFVGATATIDSIMVDPYRRG